LNGTGSIVESFGYGSEPAIFSSYHPSAGETSNAFSGTVIDILDFSSTSKRTTSRIFGGYTSGSNDSIWFGSGLSTNTAAITSFEIYTPFDGFTAGSRFSLYGIRG
jgi:hypothetical protein